MNKVNTELKSRDDAEEDVVLAIANDLKECILTFEEIAKRYDLK